jgi:UDP-N-acetylglucosamine--N-acetylmuramyl-(pentapeptide) pyrophosphoryl-undecaprenol N-acetylglucosamine transferase
MWNRLLRRRNNWKNLKPMPRIIISGGGTGGHVFPAIAIADALREFSPGANILFVGANGKIEMKKVPAAGYNIKGITIAGFQRGQILKNLLLPFKLLAGMFAAWRIVATFRPDIAVGVGGYASGPVLKICSFMGIPYVLQEQNSFAGVTNRMLAGGAAMICVAYDGMERYFPSAKIMFTGNPVRKGLVSSKYSKEEALARFDLKPAKNTVLIFGGSLGAKSINEAVVSAQDALTEMTDTNVIWQTGPGHYEGLKASEVSKLRNVRVMPFIEDMDAAYAAADVVVCRAGALTISELALLQKACILVPSPYVAEDHQTNNAKALTSRNAAVLVDDKKLATEFIPALTSLLNDETKRRVLAENIAHFARPDAATRIAGEILSILKTTP